MAEQEAADLQEELSAIAVQWRLLVKKRPEALATPLADFFALQARAVAELGDGDFSEFMRLTHEWGGAERAAGVWPGPSPDMVARLRRFVDERAVPGGKRGA